MLQPEFTSGQRRTLGTSFHTSCKPQMSELINWLQPLIDNFESQSGGESMGPLSLRTFVSITDITGIPEPNITPVSASQANVDYIKEVKAETKRATDRGRKAAPTLTVINSGFEAMSSKLDSGFAQVVQAIKSQPSSTQPSSTQPQASSFGGIDWTPIIQGLVSGVASSLGGTVNFNSSPSVPAQTTQSTADISPLLTRLDKLESNVNLITTNFNKLVQSHSDLTSNVNSLAQGQSNLTSTVNTLAQTLETFIKVSTPSSNGNSSTNGSSTPSSKNTPPDRKSVV